MSVRVGFSGVVSEDSGISLEKDVGVPVRCANACDFHGEIFRTLTVRPLRGFAFCRANGLSLLKKIFGASKEPTPARHMQWRMGVALCVLHANSDHPSVPSLGLAELRKGWEETANSSAKRETRNKNGYFVFALGMCRV